jgi:DNA-binding SARP family transcriptional activator
MARKALVASKLDLGLAEGVTVDVRHAQALARRLLDPAVLPDRSELGAVAVAALSADLLPDWYDDWVLIEAEDWRQLRLHALEALAGRLTACGRWGEAASAAIAAVRAEPLREAPMPPSSRYTWPRAISRRQCACLGAIGRFFAPSSA